MTAITFHSDATTAEELRERAAARDAEAQASFERCDTDGFMSQWAHGVNGALDRVKADLADNGGMHEFAALFDLEGNLVAAKEIETRYGWSWALLEVGEDESVQRIAGWFNESRAQKDATRIKNDAKKGFYVGRVKAPAYARLAGGNVCTVSPCVFRKDGGYSANVEIIDNGK